MTKSSDVGSELIRVCMVDPDKPTRRALARQVEGSPDLSCVGQFASIASALADWPKEGVDVLVMDADLPAAETAECVRKLRSRSPETELLVYTNHEDIHWVTQMLRAGATGYILKRMPIAELLQAVRDISAGAVPMTSTVARRLLEVFRGSTTMSLADEVDTLSQREKQVLRLLAEGLLVKEIANQLNVSFSTARTYIRRIFEKLHVQSRSQAAAKYYNSLP